MYDFALFVNVPPGASIFGVPTGTGGGGGGGGGTIRTLDISTVGVTVWEPGTIPSRVVVEAWGGGGGGGGCSTAVSGGGGGGGGSYAMATFSGALIANDGTMTIDIEAGGDPSIGGGGNNGSRVTVYPTTLAVPSLIANGGDGGSGNDNGTIPASGGWIGGAAGTGRVIVLSVAGGVGAGGSASTGVGGVGGVGARGGVGGVGAAIGGTGGNGGLLGGGGGGGGRQDGNSTIGGYGSPARVRLTWIEV